MFCTDRLLLLGRPRVCLQPKSIMDDAEKGDMHTTDRFLLPRGTPLSFSSSSLLALWPVLFLRRV